MAQHANSGKKGYIERCLIRHGSRVQLTPRKVVKAFEFVTAIEDLRRARAKSAKFKLRATPKFLEGKC